MVDFLRKEFSYEKNGNRDDNLNKATRGKLVGVDFCTESYVQEQCYSDSVAVYRTKWLGLY
jgi:hypothetical protein